MTSNRTTVTSSLWMARFVSVVGVVALFFYSGCSCTAGPAAGSARCGSSCAAGTLCVGGRCVAPGDADTGTGDADTDAGLSSDAGPMLLPPGTCSVTPSVEPFAAPQLEYHWQGDGLPFPTYQHVLAAPIVVNFVPEPLDHDMVPEIVFPTFEVGSDGGVLRVVSGRAPHDTLMTLPGDGSGPAMVGSTAVPSISYAAHPAAGDLDGDGEPEVVSMTLDGVIAYKNDGSVSWHTVLPTDERTPAALAIHDLDGDGRPEVILGAVVLDGQDGHVLWAGTGSEGGFSGGGWTSCVADIVPSCPGQEVIAGDTVYSATGTILWRASPQTDGFCAIADVMKADGTPGRDGVPEVIRVAEGVLYIEASSDGTTLYQQDIPGSSGEHRGGAPTVADFDGDGTMDIGVANASAYAVFDLKCVGAARPSTCAGDGILWTAPTQDTSSAVTSSTVFDFNGDGRSEVIYNDEDHFFVFDGVTGSVLFSEPNPSQTATEEPVVADVDNDGNAEIVFGANVGNHYAGGALPSSERIPGLSIWGSADDSWVGARPIWNQHTYHIDSVDNAGRILSPEMPSWLDHNTYRANAASGNPLAAPDLLGVSMMPDTSACPDSVRVCADVRNQGDVEVGPGIEVTFYDGDPASGGAAIGTATTTHNIDRGQSESVCIDWSPAPTSPTTVFAKVDSGDAARECNEDNNVVQNPRRPLRDHQLTGKPAHSSLRLPPPVDTCVLF